MLIVKSITGQAANQVVEQNHYLHRRAPCSFAFGLFSQDDDMMGVIMFGTPGSRHLQKSISPDDPQKAIELNRLWVDDRCPRNTESMFIRSAIRKMPPFIIASYADTSAGHFGYVYRAAGFDYAGWTDMDRKTPRFDYVVPNRHSRDAFRSGEMRDDVVKIRRLPKVKYWTVSGNRRERRNLRRLCGWPSMNWKITPPPSHHRKLNDA